MVKVHLFFLCRIFVLNLLFIDYEEEEFEEIWVCQEKDCHATIKVRKMKESERITLESQNIEHSCPPCLRMTVTN